MGSNGHSSLCPCVTAFTQAAVVARELPAAVQGVGCCLQTLHGLNLDYLQDTIVSACPIHSG